jgi:hypothetical protein
VRSSRSPAHRYANPAGRGIGLADSAFGRHAGQTVAGRGRGGTSRLGSICSAHDAPRTRPGRAPAPRGAHELRLPGRIRWLSSFGVLMPRGAAPVAPCRWRRKPGPTRRLTRPQRPLLLPAPFYHYGDLSHVYPTPVAWGRCWWRPRLRASGEHLGPMRAVSRSSPAAS